MNFLYQNCSSALVESLLLIVYLGFSLLCAYFSVQMFQNPSVRGGTFDDAVLPSTFGFVSVALVVMSIWSVLRIVHLFV